MKKIKPLVKKGSYEPFEETVPIPPDMDVNNPDIDEIIQKYKYAGSFCVLSWFDEESSVDSTEVNVRKELHGPFDSKNKAEESCKDEFLLQLGERNHRVYHIPEEGWIVVCERYSITIKGRIYKGDVWVNG